MKNAYKEFQNFILASEMKPPDGITDALLSKVRIELNPSSWKVFSKMTFIHAVVGTITLLFCPQFGISLFSDMGLMALFMQFGEIACMFGCGSVFLGGSALVSALILRPEEIKVIRKNRWVQFSILSGFSLGALICLGASVVMTLGVAWFMGSILAGLGSLELGWMLRRIKYSV